MVGASPLGFRGGWAKGQSHSAPADGVAASSSASAVKPENSRHLIRSGAVVARWSVKSMFNQSGRVCYTDRRRNGRAENSPCAKSNHSHDRRAEQVSTPTRRCTGGGAGVKPDRRPVSSRWCSRSVLLRVSPICVRRSKKSPQHWHRRRPTNRWNCNTGAFSTSRGITVRPSRPSAVLVRHAARKAVADGSRRVVSVMMDGRPCEVFQVRRRIIPSTDPTAARPITASRPPHGAELQRRSHHQRIGYAVLYSNSWRGAKVRRDTPLTRSTDIASVTGF